MSVLAIPNHLHDTGRLRVGIKQKLFFYVVVLLVVWQLLQNQTINNILVSFLFAGVVPGTNKVLSPNTVMEGAGGLLLLGCTVLLYKAVHRSRKVRQPAPFNQATLEVVATLALAMTTRSTARKSPRQTNHWRQKLRVNTSPVILPARLSALQPGLSRTFGIVRSSYLAVVSLILDMSTKLQIIACKLALLAWRYTEPWLRQLDKWLELRAHKAKLYMNKKLHQHDNFMFLLELSRQAATTTTLVNGPIWSAATKQWRKLRRKLIA